MFDLFLVPIGGIEESGEIFLVLLDSKVEVVLDVFVESLYVVIVTFETLYFVVERTVLYDWSPETQLAVVV